MKKLVLVGLIGISLVGTLSVVNTHAATNREYKKESIEDYIDIEAMGGKVLTEENSVFTLNNAKKGVAPKVNPEPVTIPIIDEKAEAENEKANEDKNSDGNDKNLEDINKNETSDGEAKDNMSDKKTEETEAMVDDNIVLNNVKAEEEAQLKEQLRKERLEEFKWLTDIGADTSGLTETRMNVLEEAHKYIGVWYRWGGTTPSGFDCSGYVRYVLKNGAGIDLPRTTYSQVKSSVYTQIPISEAKPGDIIFGHGLGHTGIFLKDNGGNITILHAPETGKQVSITTYTKPQYAYRYTE